MNTIPLSRSFFRAGMLFVFASILLLETLYWCFDYPTKMIKVGYAGGLLPYTALYSKFILLPGIIAVLLLALLMNGVRRWFSLQSVDQSWSSIGRYELLFLPLMLVAYGLILPFTNTFHYLLTGFPDYSFTYWSVWISPIYTWDLYLKRLPLILLLGYGTLNTSLLLDYLQGRRSARLTESALTTE